MKTVKKVIMGTVIGVAAFVILQLTVEAASFEVYPGTGTYPTIQSAVNAAGSATEPNVINVHAGTYNETIVISRKNNLTIQGAGDGVVSVTSCQFWSCNNSNLSGLATGVSANNVLVIGGANITIENNTMSGSSGNYVIYVASSRNLNIEGNTVISAGLGINLYDSESAVVEGNTLSNCTIKLDHCPGISLISENKSVGTTRGVYVIATTVDIVGNNITSTEKGIVLHAPTSGFEISDNVIKGSDDASIGIEIFQATAGGNYIVSGNECSGKAIGITVGYGTTSTIQISGNTCIDNSYGGMLLTGPVIVTDNICGDNTNDGIYISNSSAAATLSGNVCYGNYFGIDVRQSPTVTMTNNTLYDNVFGTLIAIEDTSGITVKNSIFAKNYLGLYILGPPIGNEGYNCQWQNDITLTLASHDVSVNPEFYSETPGDTGFLYLSCDTSMEVLLGASDGLNMGALPVYGGPCGLSQEDADAILADCAVAVRNHGQFVSCVADVANNLIEVGYLQGSGSLVKQAAHSNIGKKK